MKRRFIVLDRDGTLIVERHYLSDPDQVELLPGAVEGLKEFRNMGFGLIVITNQSAIGRGYFTLDRLEEIHARLNQLLADQGIKLDGIYICPHTPADECSCRKPKPGLLLEAAREQNFNPKDCIVIGDKPCDIELGEAVGATTVLVTTGYGRQYISDKQIHPDFIAENLITTAQYIQRQFRTNEKS